MFGYIFHLVNSIKSVLTITGQ